MSETLYTVVLERPFRPAWDVPSEYLVVRSGLTGPEADELEAKLNSEEPVRLYSFEFDDAWPEETVIVVTDEEARNGAYRRAV